MASTSVTTLKQSPLLPRRVVRRPLQFTSPAKEQQYRADMDHVQRYICAQVGGLDNVSSRLLGVHDTHSCSYYEEIQDFLDRKHRLEQQQQLLQTVNAQSSERVLIRGLDEFLNELDPSLFAESESTGPPRLSVANLPVHSSYIRRKQEEAMLTRLWSKCNAVETERCTVAPISWGGPIKRQRVV